MEYQAKLREGDSSDNESDRSKIKKKPTKRKISLLEDESNLLRAPTQ